jgi:hypothetical protein
MKNENLTEDKAEQTSTGGVLVGKREGQTIIHNKGSLSGYLVGKTHAEGGIKAINKSTGQPLEMQGGEVVITAPAVSDNTKREFEGKMMTNREILSAINEKGGGVAFANGGDVPKSIKHTGASYKYGGKTMTDHDILKHIAGGHLAEGYSLREIANIHQVPLSELKEQVRLGMKAESEHTPNKREQMKIVKDHLFENPKYYTLLKKAGLEDGGYFTIYKKESFANGGSVLENNFPDEVIGNDNIVFVKEWEINQNDKNIAHYNIYWKGYDIDFGGRTFESIKSLKIFKENYILSNNLYDKLKYQPEKQIPNKSKFNNGGQTESLVRDSKNGNTPARDLNNYNDVLDLQADNMVGADTGLFATGGDVKPYDANMEGDSAYLVKEDELSQEQINETIETLEILYESSTRKDKQDIKEAIEVLKML